MTGPTSRPGSGNPGPRAGAAVAAVAAAALTHLAFLGWDREVDVDPVTGSTSGPYSAWQVVGCAVVLAVVGFLARRVLPAWLSAAATSLGFTVAWSVGAATTPVEDADLWPIGAALLAPAVFAWALLAALVARRTARRAATRPQGTSP